MEDIHSSYLSGQDDVDNLPYPLPSLGQNEACAPMPCPGGVEIVLVGGGEPTVGAYPGETGVLPSYSHIGYREESRDGMRLTHSREPDGLNCGIMGRPEQDHLSPKYSLPPPDHSTLHHFAAHQPGTHTTPWRYSDTNEDIERESDGVHPEEQYLQHRRFEWTSGLEDGEGHSQLMMVRSDPPSITMPAFRRALQLGRVHEAWQGGNYSEEDAHVEVEEEEEEEGGSVYTCIECSIYFKKKTHLLEHMFQHSQEGEDGRHGVECTYTCGECGKGFGDEESLESHRQLHQESRNKIIEEISKLESFADEGRDARLQCPKCLFGTNSSKVFVQHAKTHVKKVGGDTRTTSSSFRVSSERADGGETSEPPTEGIWKPQEIENSAESEWKMDLTQAVVKSPSKMKGKTIAREEHHSLQNNNQRVEKEGNKPRKTVRLPETAVQLKRRFRDVLRAAGEGEGDQRRLREEVAVVLLENINAKKKRTKGNQTLGYRKKLPISKTLFSRASLAHHLPREDWADDAEDDIPLDTLLTDPKYASQLEALGLRSEERECPYCPDRFHNGIGLANHVRGHLNRVGVSYNVRHFISAEEVKAIEQNYSFQKKRKKVANFDPSTFSLMRCEFCGAGFDTRAGLSSHARAHLRDFGITNWELTVSPIHVLARLLARSPGRPLPPIPPWHQDTDTDVLASDEDDGPLIELVRAHGSQPEHSSAERMMLDQSTSKGDDPKGQNSITCELCGACFETRKGLSSHARSHLRQLGIPGSETSGAPIDLLKELAKQGKHPKDESSLVAKKLVNPQQEAQWGDEDGPLNLSVEGDSNQENDCQFCGAWFDTRKGLSSHARAHLRHLGVADPDEKGSPIATLNFLLQSEDFKKRISGQTTIDTDPLAQAPSNDNSDTEGNIRSKSKEAGISTKPTENTNKTSSDAPANLSEGGPHSISTESALKLMDSAGPIETSTRYRSPSGSGNSTQLKIVEAGAPRVLSPEAITYSKLAETSSSQINPEAGHGPSKMESGNQSKPSIGGLVHPRPTPTSTTPTKKMKTPSPSCKSNLDSYWAQKNSSTPLNLSSQSDASRDIRCEFCNEFFENRKGLSSHARSHLRQMGITEWHVNGSPIDTLREIIRKRHPATPQQQISNIKKEPCEEEEPPSPSHRLSPLGVAASVMPRDVPISPTGRPYNSFLSPIPAKRPMPHEPRLTQPEPKGFMNAEPKTCSPSKSYLQGQSRPKSYITEDGRPKAFIHSDGNPKHFLQSGEGRPKTFVQEGRPKGFLPSENRPKAFLHGEGKLTTYLQGDGKPKSFMPGENRPKPFLPGEPKPKSFSPDGKIKAYIQSELPFKVKMKASPEKAVTSMEAACELCGLVFENRKALASHARAHLRQFGVTEWCVNGSPIETLREWMKQRPQKTGAYLSYIQGRPFSKKFKRALQNPKPGPVPVPEKESPTATPGKVAEKEHILLIPCSPTEKIVEPQAQKFERRPPKASEVPPIREDIVSEPLPKNEEPRPPVRPRPVPSLVPRPPQKSLVKFVGTIYTLKCRFCDTQFEGPLSTQIQWIRHLQHHILKPKFSKAPSPPQDVSSQEQSEAVTSQ